MARKTSSDDRIKHALPITDDQRRGIREALEMHYSPEHGCYFDGYTDRKISEELNVPWAHVEAIREFAYGPLEVDADFIVFADRLEHAYRALDQAIEVIRSAKEEISATRKALKAKQEK